MSRQDKGGAGMILNRGPPSGFETSNKISNSGGTDMYIQHPYFYEGKYYANIDGEMIEITKLNLKRSKRALLHQFYTKHILRCKKI